MTLAAGYAGIAFWALLHNEQQLLKQEYKNKFMP